MDGVFIGALAVFTALILGSIAGCEKLAQYGRGGAHDLDAVARGMSAALLFAYLVYALLRAEDIE
ncbi:potassium-transporting ATPase subunit A [Burkholderia multivorans]|nr:potassium-transporting ATPase subunit A [Burkholderia multivorans]